ncbi:hypothetical protein ACSFBX_34230 [Variovorax sp. RB2P76]|uniref:hypothetical protein n=1 Tax=Variovorax sp. RB2P76 TaxID=3443736 RepID=UPI003F4533EF
MKRVVRAALSGLVSLVIAACGGGGGGGGGGGAAFPLGAAPAPVVPVPPPVNYVSGLSIRINQPASVDQTVYEGQQVSSVLVSGTLSGDATLLNGKVLVLLVVMPDALFEDKPRVSIDVASRSASLLMTGKVAPDGVRVYKDNITIKACLDTACQSEIRVENPQIPYTIAVKAGLTLGQKSVDFVTPFGTFPAPVRVPVGLPADLASWSVAPVIGDTAGFKVEKASDGSQNVVVSLDSLAPSGTSYKGSFAVKVTTQDGQQLSKMFDVSLQTTPSSAPYVLSRPEARFVVKQGTPTLAPQVDTYVYFPGNTSDRMSYVGTVLSAPSGADTSMYPAPNLWLYFRSSNESGTPKYPTRSDSWTTQVQACYNGRCLTPGTYGAVVQFRYAPVGGPVSDIYYPVVMDVVP